MQNTTIANPALLLVEDDGEIREQMKWALASEFTVLEAKDRRTAIALLRRETPRLVVLDLGLPPAPDVAAEGLAALQEIIEFDPTTKVIVATGNSDRAVAMIAIQRGAYDFIEKPVQLDVLRVILQRAAYLSRLEQENRTLQEQATVNGFGELLGESPSMQHIFEVVRRVAASDVPVLITGESGTGKELVARAIHRYSTRKAGPFIPINCSAIPENLLESELFGHEKGAFTDAHRQQKGKFEFAHGGTLLLDEIGEMPLGLQVKLLRFLQDGQLERVGGREPIMVNTRVLAATNVDLKAAIERGLFRTDLFYRLSVIEVAVPPLRERAEDAVMLAQAFSLRYRETLNARVTGLSDESREAIRAYAWPGNVRELENRIKRAVVMAKGPMLQPADLELPSSGPATRPLTLKEARARVEKERIQGALASHHWNISRAAEELGFSRQSLHEFIQKYGLQKPSLTEEPPGPAIVTDES
jgi:two-component system NtrC family response regulator